MRHAFFALPFLLAASTLPVFASVDNGLLALAPENTKIVFGMDAQRMKDSDFGQFLLRRHDTQDQEFQSFVQATGFDPRKDVSYILGVSPAVNRNTQGLMFFRGSFDLDRITAAAKAHGAKVEIFGGSDLILANDKDGAKAIGFPETGVAVAGAPDMVRSVITNRGSVAPLDPALATLITAASADNDIWFASTAPAASIAGSAGLPGAAGGGMSNAQVLRSIQQASGGLRFGDMVQLTIDAVTRSAQDALSLLDVVRFVSGMLESKAQNDPSVAPLSTAVQQMQLQSTGPNVHIALALPEKTLEQLTQSGTQPAVNNPNRTHP